MSMRRWGWILLPMLVLVGLRIGAMGSPAVRASGWVVDFFDDFAANTGWNVSDAPGGTVAFGHNDGGVSVLRLDQPNGGAYPLVGREGLFNSIPSNVPWAFEIRFRFPEVTAYG
ncbi:MAG: hypothetical protein QN194_16195, partial [Armatimonadota bacterium]|nr:hypothetical protein [Armatimonadota bacterium]